jgi:hypothetical protein
LPRDHHQTRAASTDGLLTGCRRARLLPLAPATWPYAASGIIPAATAPSPRWYGITIKRNDCRGCCFCTALAAKITGNTYTQTLDKR